MTEKFVFEIIGIFLLNTIIKWEENKMKKTKRTRNRRRNYFNLKMFIFVFVFAATVGVTTHIVDANRNYKKLANLYEPGYDVIEIKPGDTAYSIAEEYKYPGMDSRDYIQQLSEINHMDLFHSDIHTGHYLMVIQYTPRK